MKYLGLILFLLASMICNAKDIRGKVVDKDGSPVELANIMLYSLPDSVYVAGTTSNVNGEFYFSDIKQKRLYISVSSIGYETRKTIVTDADITVSLAPVAVGLDEVVVQGNSRYVTGDKIVFMPSKRDKQLSSDGIGLLRNMALPVIRISPRNEVTDMTGEAVNFYIDYHAASDEDVKGLLTSDVQNVEFLEAPSDPRFHGDRNVVHFITKQYAFGGYTKPYIEQNLINKKGSYGVNSKFVYKSTTYDLLPDLGKI